MKSSTKIFALAALVLAAGCADPDDAASLSGPLAAGGTGGAPGEKPGSAGASGGVGGAPGEKPGPGCTTPPAPSDPVKCWAEETKEGTCKVCVDANGHEVVRSCAAPAPEQKCWSEETKEGICKVCVDANGGIVRSCVATPAEPKCYETQGKDGETCKVCLDPATGKELVRACVRAGGEPGTEVKCEEYETGGVVCKICRDSHGSVVSKDCPTP
jgi:hypothetical protein